MATKPAQVELQASGADILNAVRNASTAEYRSLVPAANGTIENLKEIGSIINNYWALKNEFLHNMVNLIGRIMVTSKMYSNPWARFKKGMLEFGETVAEYFVNLPNPHPYNPEVAEEKWMKREIPDVRSAFHTVNYKAFYKQTIQQNDLVTAFYSWQGIDDLIAKIVDSMYSRDAYDEFNAMKYMIAKALSKGAMHPVTLANSGIPTDNAAVFRGLSNNLTFMSPNYNAAGVLNYTDRRNQILIMNSEFDAQFDVNVLASAFNLSYADFLGQRVLVDNFGNIDIAALDKIFADEPLYTGLTQAELEAVSKVPAVLVDADWFMIFDNQLEFTENFNGEGRYWQYWLHVWKTLSFSPFANAIVFGESDATVTGVTVSPTEVTMSAGQYVQMTAKVQGTNFVNGNVIWSSNNTNVTVNAQGLVVANAQATGTATITATSVADNTKSGTATITIG